MNENLSFKQDTTVYTVTYCILISFQVDKKEVAVHIFDTSGSALFVDVRNEFYADAHGIVLMFDVTRRQTFDDLDDWLLEIRREVLKKASSTSGTQSPVIVVCANKIDIIQGASEEDKRTQFDDVSLNLLSSLYPYIIDGLSTPSSIN